MKHTIKVGNTEFVARPAECPLCGKNHYPMSKIAKRHRRLYQNEPIKQETKDGATTFTCIACPDYPQFTNTAELHNHTISAVHWDNLKTDWESRYYQILDAAEVSIHSKENKELLNSMGMFAFGTKELIDNMIATGKKPTQDEIEQAQMVDIVMGMAIGIARRALNDK